ncbi:unnamed protein product [Cochlearia groenlandica]
MLTHITRILPIFNTKRVYRGRRKRPRDIEANYSSSDYSSSDDETGSSSSESLSHGYHRRHSFSHRHARPSKRMRGLGHKYHHHH